MLSAAGETNSGTIIKIAVRKKDSWIK